MRQYYSYARVSTVKQGEQGVSLQAQRDAIAHYASRNQLTILDWFEERETAAKRGRPVFDQMMRLLRQGKAEGVVIHKIDRSARNLKDWSDLGELIDQGIEVHFANESLDLHSRGGRLSADIQAVIAADFIRNLREETKKGIMGRLKQGLLPLPAPLGYLDVGPGKPKIPDPVKGPLIRQAFDLYASGNYGLIALADELHRRGLRNRAGAPVDVNRLSVILHNPFYIGLIRIKSGETFVGVHEPLVKKAVFDRVQAVLQGKMPVRTQKHAYLFRRLLTCKHCGLTLIGERQKGRVYYRCHTRVCPTRGVREDTVQEAFSALFAPLQFTEHEKLYFQTKIKTLRTDWAGRTREEAAALTLKLGGLKDRLARMTDAFIDQSLDKELFEERKLALLLERRGLEERLADLGRDGSRTVDRLQEFLELAGSLSLNHEMGNDEEKRELIKIATSNRSVEGKTLYFKLSNPFEEVAKRQKTDDGVPYRDEPRTLDKWCTNIFDAVSKLPFDFLEQFNSLALHVKSKARRQRAEEGG